MNKRRCDILFKLAQRSQDEYKISDLAKYFKVSEKTIRNDIKNINYFLNRYGYNEIKFLGNGCVQFSGKWKDVTIFLKKNNLYSYKLEKDERIRFIALLLIQSVGYISLDYISEKLFVSRSTIVNDLKDVKNFCQTENLRVISKPSKGILLEGSENHKRSLAYKILCNRYQYNSIFNPYELFEFNSFEDENVRNTLSKIILDAEKNYNFMLTGDSFNNLIAYLIIAVKRIQLGFFAEPEKILDENWFEIAAYILKQVARSYHLKIKKEEEILLCNLLGKLNYLAKSNKDQSIIKLQMVTRKFIEKISSDLQIDLNHDYLFFQSLINHLEFISQKEVTPPPLEELFSNTEDLTKVYQVVSKNINILQSAIGKAIPKNELYYIVIHVCAAIERKKSLASKLNVIVVCKNGVGTSQLISERLKKYFNFTIKDVVAQHNLYKVLNDNIDLIISTVPIEETNHIENIVINPDLTNNDIMQIYSKIKRIQSRKNLNLNNEQNVKKDPYSLIKEIKQISQQYIKENLDQFMEGIVKLVFSFFDIHESESPALYQLLKPEHIQLNVQCSSYQEAIRNSAKILLERDYIEERYISAMIKNIEENGPYVVISKDFAVPHAAIGEGGKRVGMSLIRLSDRINFLGVPVKYVCSLSVVDSKKHLNALFNLVNMLSIPDFRNSLDKAQTPIEVSNLIKKFELGSNIESVV